MDNIVTLQSERPRPPRGLGVPRSGARILFFTGVRYCRDEDPAPFTGGADRRTTPDGTHASGQSLEHANFC